MANTIGDKKWGEVWKRCVMIDGATNVGIGATRQSLADGEGNVVPMLFGLSDVAMDGTAKFIYGDENLYIRKLRTGVLQVGAPKVVFANASLNTLSFTEIVGDAADIKDGRFEVIEADEVVASSMDFTDVNCEKLVADQVETPMLSAASYVNSSCFMAWW